MARNDNGGKRTHTVSFSWGDGYDRSLVGLISCEIGVLAENKFDAAAKAWAVVSAVAGGKEPKNMNVRGSSD